MIRRMMPHPLLSLTIFALWMVLAPRVSAGHIVLAAALGLSIPRIMVRFWPERRVIHHPLLALRLGGIFLLDIMVANWVVARQVLGPTDALRPQFIEIPLDLRDVFVATLLGSIVALTPGTVSVDVDRDRWVLLVHALHAEDPQSVIDTVKRRYEAPMKEIFAC